jgi:malonate decarboxylase gamma subunit
LLYKLLHVANPENPAAAEVSLVCDELIVAIQDARKGPRDLRNRIDSEGARTARKASLLIQARVEEEWNQ